MIFEVVIVVFILCDFLSNVEIESICWLIEMVLMFLVLLFINYGFYVFEIEKIY